LKAHLPEKAYSALGKGSRLARRGGSPVGAGGLPTGYKIGPNRHYEWIGSEFVEALTACERDVRSWIQETRDEAQDDRVGNA
jgi:hypothetical protein